jgi:hypothetical protein
MDEPVNCDGIIWPQFFRQGDHSGLVLGLDIVRQAKINAKSSRSSEPQLPFFQPGGVHAPHSARMRANSLSDKSSGLTRTSTPTGKYLAGDRRRHLHHELD